MSDRDRLEELRRQREALDREIAAAESGATGGTPLPPPAAPSPSAFPGPASNASAAADVAPESTVSTDAILEEYRVAPDAVRQDVRKGCFLYFTAAFALFALGVAGLYFALRRD